MGPPGQRVPVLKHNGKSGTTQHESHLKPGGNLVLVSISAT